MNIAQHMEAIFVITIALIGATSAATAATPALFAARQAAAPVAVTVNAGMQVVTVSAKRMSKAEKALFDQQ